MGVFEVVLGLLVLLSPMLVWWAVLKFKNRNLPKYNVKYDEYEPKEYESYYGSPSGNTKYYTD
jgi:hypothetical protein